MMHKHIKIASVDFHRLQIGCGCMQLAMQPLSKHAATPSQSLTVYSWAHTQHSRITSAVAAMPCSTVLVLLAAAAATVFYYHLMTTSDQPHG
jgi:hypothetical protein